MSGTPERGISIAVVPDGRAWSILTSEPLPMYQGHFRSARETHSGFYCYPFCKEETARRGADRVAREMGRKVL